MSEKILEDEVISLLDRLVDKSLVIWEGQNYRLLSIVRAFGLQELCEQGAEIEVRDQHLTYFAEFAAQSDARLHAPDQQQWRQTYLSMHDDLRAALDYGLTSPAHSEKAMEMAYNLGTFWFNEGYFSEGAYYLDQALVSCSDEASDLRSRLLRRAGIMHLYSKDPRAKSMLEEALLLAERSGSSQTLGDAHYCLALNTYDANVAKGHLKAALEIFEQIGDLSGVGYVLCTLGELNFTEGHYEASRVYLQRSYEVRRDTGDVGGLGAAIASLAEVELAVGNDDEARLLLNEALETLTKVGAFFRLFSMLPSIAALLARKNNREDAARLMGQSEKLRRETNGIRDPMDQMLFDSTQAELIADLGDSTYAGLQEEGMALGFENALTLAERCLRGDAKNLDALTIEKMSLQRE